MRERRFVSSLVRDADTCVCDSSVSLGIPVEARPVCMQASYCNDHLAAVYGNTFAAIVSKQKMRVERVISALVCIK